MTILRKYAGYVEITCNDDMATLLSSGFEARSTDRTAVVLDNPDGLVVSNGNSGQLIAKIKSISGTSLYEGRVKPVGGDWLPSVFTGDSRHITFDGLTRGTEYVVSVRALGGSTGQSDWCPEVSQMSL